jgi:hypothetical protein
MALRLSGQLLLGICRIFSRKTRYLLEDCNEALLTLKMAFRPGAVDMVHESANINMPETINEFDILMSDVPFDLTKLLQPQQTPVLDQTYLSQQSFDDISFEVGRDAQQSVQYSPAKDTTLDRSLMKESFLSMQVPRNEEDALGDQGALDFGFDDVPPQDDFDIYRGDDAPMNLDLDIPLVAAAAENDIGGFEFNTTMDTAPLEIPSVLADLTFNQPEEVEKTPTKKRVVQQKKRKNMMDTKIELTSEQLKSQLKDTSDIETFVFIVDVVKIMSRFDFGSVIDKCYSNVLFGTTRIPSS